MSASPSLKVPSRGSWKLSRGSAAPEGGLGGMRVGGAACGIWAPGGVRGAQARHGQRGPPAYPRTAPGPVRCGQLGAHPREVLKSL